MRDSFKFTRPALNKNSICIGPSRLQPPVTIMSVGRKAKSATADDDLDSLFATLHAAKKSKDDSAAPKDRPSASQITQADESEASEAATDSSFDVFSDHDTDLEDAPLAPGTPYDPSKDELEGTTRREEAKTHQHPKDDDFFDSRGTRRKTRPLTADGLPIYSPKELRIGLGGGTKLCPFDCNCCY